MIALMHPPSRAYIDPWTGQLFGEGGVEKSSKTGSNTPVIGGVHGEVIMGKLGNATAKFVYPSFFCTAGGSLLISMFVHLEQLLVERRGNYCEWGSPRLGGLLAYCYSIQTLGIR